MKLKILQSNLYVKDTQWNLKRMSACLIFLRECHMHYHSSVARYLCLVVRGGCNGKTSGHVIYLLAGAPVFTLCYFWVRVTQSLVFCVVFCGSLFVLLSFPLGGHCIVCPTINGFWLPCVHWLLQTFDTYFKQKFQMQFCFVMKISKIRFISR
jgi:hypothetical protein